MSPQNIVDAEELNLFTAELKYFTGSVENELVHLETWYNRVCETWQDDQQQRFGEKFEAMAKLMHKFLDDMEGEIPSLQRKVDYQRNYGHS
jgi:hypothetical protein